MHYYSTLKTKRQIKELTQLCFLKKDQRRYKCLVLGRDKSYVKKDTHSDSTRMFSETNIIKILEFLIDNRFLFVCWACFSTESAYLWVLTVPPSRRLVSIFVKSIPYFI